MFDRATITLGIGPHSSLHCFGTLRRHFTLNAFVNSILIEYVTQNGAKIMPTGSDIVHEDVDSQT